VIGPPIVGVKLSLLPINENIVTEEYISWLSNPTINKYLEVRHLVSTIDTQRRFIQMINESEDTIIYGIFCEDVFIGTIKVGPVDKNYHTAEIGLLIGNSHFWGRGIATESIKLVSATAVRIFELRKLTAGAYESNIGSIKAFLSNGFLIEGKLASQVLDVNQVPMAVILLGKVY